MNRISVLAAILGNLLAASAFAQEAAGGGGQGQEGHMRREPPPQAYEVCKGRQEGDAVQFTTRRGKEISATCTSSPKGLFARPQHPPREHEEGTPSGGKPD
jgi:hypothetical protein